MRAGWFGQALNGCIGYHVHCTKLTILPTLPPMELIALLALAIPDPAEEETRERPSDALEVMLDADSLAASVLVEALRN